MTGLRDAVDALTKPWTHGVYQPATDDQPEQTVSLKHRPRLQMLEDAIVTSTNKDGGGALARERDVMNSTAAQMLIDYRRQINKAAKLLDVAPGAPIPTLRAWYVASLAKVTTDAWAAQWEALFTRWAGEIDSLLNPPQQVVVERPCPQCEAAFYIDKADKTKKPWPLRARKWDFRQHGTDAADASCIVCGARWDGLTAVRELAFWLEERDREKVQTGS